MDGRFSGRTPVQLTAVAGAGVPGAVCATRKAPRGDDLRLWAWCCLKGPAGISEIRCLTSFVHSFEDNTLIYFHSFFFFFLIPAGFITANSLMFL